MTIVVLITQNRQGQLAERRARLDLHISLLVDQKMSKLVEMIVDLRRDLSSVRSTHDPEAEAMKEATDPHEVLTSLNRLLKEAEEEAVKEQ